MSQNTATLTQPVAVPEAIHSALLALRDSGETNMLDVNTVILLLARTDLDAAYWVNAKPKRYVTGVFVGFRPYPPNRRQRKRQRKALAQAAGSVS